MKSPGVSLEHQLVLRILPKEFLLTTALLTTASHTHSMLIRWKFPKTVDPNNINADLELLSAQLAQLSETYGLDGSTLTVILPHHVAAVKTLDIPMNLAVKADRKEYASATKLPYDFWKEFDDSLVDFKEAEIRAHYLYSNPIEGSSRMLYCATSAKVIKDYTTLVLGGNLYPTAFVAEDQAIIKIVESRLSRVEKERAFCVFHLSQGNHRLLHCSDEEVNIAKVDISDLDEVLLDDVPVDDEMDNEFWTEVANRISGALKQAVSFLRDERKVSAFETVFFISDYAEDAALFKLFHKNFRLANFRSLSDDFTYQEVSPYQAGVQEDKKTIAALLSATGLKTSASLMPSAGCYGLSPAVSTSVSNRIIEAPLHNLHAQARFIGNNFKYQRSVKWGSLALALAVIVFAAVDFYASFLSAENEALEQKFKTLQADYNSKSAMLQTLHKNAQAANQKYDDLSQALLGKNNAYIMDMINHNLPIDLELDRLVVRDASFSIDGNSNSVSDINLFYERLLAQPGFTELKINVYKRADSKLDYFSISGKTLN